MTVSYDMFVDAFLNKMTDYRFPTMFHETRQAIIDGYMKRACTQFSEVFGDSITEWDDEMRTIEIEELTHGKLHEVVDIVSEGMLVQWMKPYIYMQRNLETQLVTNDHSFHSQAELTNRISAVYDKCERDFTNRIRQFSYRHGDLTDLHT